jgi:hypothetical protein
LDLRKILLINAYISRLVGANLSFLFYRVNNILLASSDLDILYEIKYILSKKLKIKNLDEVSYVIGIEIH